MIAQPGPSAKDPEAWIAWIQQRARIEVPEWLNPTQIQPLPSSALRRLAHRQQLQHLTTPVAAATVASPTTPIPELSVSRDLPETGSMRRLETEMIPAIKLLQPMVDVRETRELISSAVLSFWTKHQCLPSVVGVNSMRHLTIAAPEFFSLDCECAEHGCYTVGVLSVPQLGCDTVLLWGRRYDRWREIEDSYL